MTKSQANRTIARMFNQIGPAPPFNARIESRIVAGFVWFLGAWALSVHFAVATGASFHRLLQLTPVTILVAVIGWFVCTRSSGDEPPINFAPWSKRWLLPAALAALSLAFGYLAYRLSALLFLCAGWVWLHFSTATHQAETQLTEPNHRARDLLGLGFLCLVGILAVLCLHRPSLDDGFYVSVTADAMRHPDRPIWSTDTIHDDPRLPVILPIYQTEANEHLAALVAQLLHLSAVRAAHTVLPVAYAVFCLLAWAMLAQTIDARHWLIITATALFISFFDGAAYAAPGNFALVHLHEGKAVLSSAIVPILYVYAWRFLNAHRSGGSWRDGLMLLMGQIAGVGLSSTGILIAPAVAGGVALVCAPLNRKSIPRLIWVGIASAYPLGLGLLLRNRMLAITWVSHYKLDAPGAVIDKVFGTWPIWLYFTALVGAWLSVPRTTARLLLAPGLILLGIIINPVLAADMQNKVFSPLTYWRGFWVVPWLVLAGTLIAGIGRLIYQAVQPRAPSLATAAAIVGGLAFAFAALQGHPVFRHSKNGVNFHFAGLAVDEPEFAVARELVKVTPPGTSALAPETVACWTAAQDQRPPLLFVRSFYTQSSQGQEDVEARNRLGEIIDRSNLGIDDIETLMSGVDRYQPGAVVLRSNAGTRASQAMKRAGFSIEKIGDYLICTHRPGLSRDQRP